MSVKYLKFIIKYLLLTLLSFALFLVILEIFYPISIDKNKDISKIVVDRDGRWLYTTLNSTDKWRFRVENIDKLDPLYIKMLLTYEDKRFYKHFGVDILALFRASYQLISSGEIKSGASTITMQLARLLEPKKRTFSSKIVEIFRSIQLEMHYSKKEILSAYLTLAPYGSNIEGVIGASLKYFGKLPYSLTPNECAILTSLPQNPQKNQPTLYPKRAKKARDRVLKRALEDGIITKKVYDRVVKTKIDIKPHKYPRFAPHLSIKLLKRSNRNRVETTLYLPLQSRIERWSKVIGDSLPKGVTMSIIVVENRSGNIVTYIGSHNIFSKKTKGYIDMVDAIRSPGSILKPLIYAIGFYEHIIDINSIIKDKESIFGEYHPHNFNQKYSDEITIKNALINSLNIPAVKVLQKIGAQKFIDTLESIVNRVVIPKGKATLPVALGGLGIKEIQIAKLYVAIANNGVIKNLHYLKNYKPKEKKILSKDAFIKVTNILRESPPPEGYTNTNGFYAYKTGTSYGYRDFWSAIYSKKYSAVILIAKPDNSPILKSSAREIAAPLGFEVMNYVKSILPHKSWSYESKKITSKIPPKLLRYFDKKELQNKKFDFLYPKNNSRFQSATCKDVLVKFKLKGGTPPYFWYIDGKPKEFKTIQIIQPFKAGAHTVSIIDKMGNQAFRDIWVNKSECKQ